MAENPPTRKFECSVCKNSDYRMSTRDVGEKTHDRCPRCGGLMEITGAKTPEWMSELLGLVSSSFEIEDFTATANRAEFEVSAPDTKRSFKDLLKDLKKHSYISAMRDTKDGPRLFVIKHPPARPSRVWINIVLFVATFFSTFMAGYFLLFGSLNYGLAFAAAIMLMLGTHELGHKISAWRNGIDATLPYFIPSPLGLGTFGAVISVKSPPPSKDALVEMGVAGPLAGFAIAVPLTIIGLLRSVPDPSGLNLSVSPLAFSIFQVGIFGHVPTALAIHPLALAGWVAMMLTMFNLIPAGQLDGGHVARAVMNRERHHSLTRTLGLGLLLSGFFAPQMPFWIWGFFIFLMFRNYHSGPLDDVSRISKRSKMLIIVSAVVFFLCIPIPVA